MVPVLALACLGLAACTNDVVATADANSSSTHALLVVEQTVPVDTEDATRSHASMWFMRVSDDQAVEAVTGLVTDLIEVPGFGQCVTTGAHAAQSIPASMVPVELAFAGEVSVRTGTSLVPLSVRAFPDVANLVSGVMYTAPGQSDLALPLGGSLEVRTSGTDGLAAMDASTQAPSPPKSVRIEGLPFDSSEVEAHAGQALNLSWIAGEPSDRIYVDIDPIPGSPSDRVRCAMPDTGSGRIAAVAIPETPALTLSIHRMRVSPLRTSAGEIGTAHFDVAVVGKVKVAAP